jgi:hypothetical protein
MRAEPSVAAIARQHLARYRALLQTRLEQAGAADPPRLARQLLLLIEGASVVTAIDGGTGTGADARQAAELLLGARL